MDHVKETLRRELRSVVRDIERTDEQIKHLIEELKLVANRNVELTNAKQQLIISLSAGALKPFSGSGNTCDICGGHLEVVETINLPGKATALKDERCPCCG